jgi:hypothetical protein
MISLAEKAQKVINNNWRDGFSIPTNKLYPFQWLWDSGFVALGNGTQNISEAIEEIDKMFSGQWANGMVPHILFHSENEKTYFPNYDFWNSNINDGAPLYPKSSGITQPPVFGFVLKELLDIHKDSTELKEFAKHIFPKIKSYHKFLYTYRDHKNEGLFHIYHPWESGRDNSPIWDKSMSRIKIDKNTIPEYTRRDTQLMDASERPTTDKYDRYVYLLELGKKYKYDGKEIAEESPFLIQDCMMNAILIKSNASLIEIGQQLHIDTQEIEEWQALSKANFNTKFWNNKLKTFVSYDCRSEEQIEHKEIGGFTAMFSECASQEQVKAIAEYLQDLHDRGYYLCPSFDVDSELFDSKRYWRGPVWPQMNWMVAKGLKAYGHNDLAEIVKSDLLELVGKLGFHEYFEPNKKIAETITKGYGGDNFSWTASTVLNFLNTEL